MLCPNCSSELPPDARFCAYCGHSVALTTPADLSSVEMIKLVTVLFADVVGSTAQAELMHPEDTRALMAEFFDAMSEEIRAEGGTVERLIGDAIMADFGVPLAREDDPLRAVRAARRMLERLDKFNIDRNEESRIAMRIGINTGAVSTGGSFGEQLLVMGDAVNVAARLEQAAQPGTIVIGERTARAVREHFKLAELEPLRAKGKSEPVAAFRVMDEIALADDVSSAFVLPLVGRETEMKKLQDVFSGVSLSATPHLVALLGDPGVGKSRLAREFLQSLDGRAKTLFGRCLPYGNGVTFWPLREILIEEAGLANTDSSDEVRHKLVSFVASAAEPTSDGGEAVLDACFATLGLQVPRSTGDTADPRETFRHLLEGWRELLSRFSADRPLVIVIEDIHWAERTMLDVLDDLVRHVDGRVMFLCPARPDLIDTHADWLGGLRNLSSIHLDPLDADASCRFMSLVLELDELPEAFTKNVLDRAEGNPFFLEEILNRLMDEGYFALRDGRWEPVRDVSDVDIPDNVQAAILARLDLLSEQEKAVMQLAAVVGRTFWASLLSELTGLADLSSVFETLVRRNLVIERRVSTLQGDREFAFKHVLTRDVAYDSLPRKSRGQAHAAVARWIEATRGPRASELADLVAHHYDRAYGWLGDDALRRKARSYFLIGSLKELLRFAIAEAEALGCRAVELSQPGTEKVEALEALGDLYTLSSSGDAAWHAFTSALDELDAMPPDDATLARIASKAATVATRWQPTMNEVVPEEEIRALVAKGLGAAGEGDSRERALLLVSRSYLQRVSEREEEEVLQDAQRALDIAERLQDAHLISAAADGLSMCLLPAARYGQIERVQLRRISIIPRLTDVREICDAYGSATWSSVFVGHYRDACEFATAAIHKARGVDPAEYLHGLFWRAQARFMSGDWDGALADQMEIERIEGDGETKMPSPFVLRGYGVAMFCQELRGDSERRDVYLRLLERSRRAAGETGQRYSGAFALPARALAHMGRPAEAREWLLLERTGYLAGQLEAACEVAAELHDDAYAQEVIALAHNEVEVGELIALRHFVERLEGRLAADQGAPEDAAHLLGHSAEGFASLAAPWEEAWSRLLLAETWATMNDREAASREAETARRIFQRLRSVAETERSQRLVTS